MHEPPTACDAEAPTTHGTPPPGTTGDGAPTAPGPATTTVEPKPPGLGQALAYRRFFRSYRQPPNYRPRLHLVTHLGPLVAAAAWAGTRLRSPSAMQWLVVPGAVTLASLFVYWFHRHVLHRPRRFAAYAYRNHTLQHHRFYDYEHITPDSIADLYVTLFPWFAGPGLAGLTLTLAWLLTPLLGNNVAYLLVLVSNGYMLAYEATHTIAHLPDAHPLLRLPILPFLREHHRLHHDPALMGKYNFNIVLPLFDWLNGAFVRVRPERAPADYDRAQDDEPMGSPD